MTAVLEESRLWGRETSISLEALLGGRVMSARLLGHNDTPELVPELVEGSTVPVSENESWYSVNLKVMFSNDSSSYIMNS